jgi:hypothetical protein
VPYTPPATFNNNPATPVSAEYFTDALQSVGDYADSLIGTTEERVVTPEQFDALAGTLNYDSTSAIQQAIDSLADGGGKVKFGPKTYLVNGVPRSDRFGNAIIAMPLNMTGGVVDPQPRIVLEGAGSCLTTIKTTRITDTYSAAYGPPSIIGGPTWEQTRDGAGNPVVPTPGITADFLDVGVIVRGIDFSVKHDTAVTTSGPRVSCLDFGGMSHATVEDCEFWSTSRNTEPKNIWTFAVRMPGTFNNGRIRVTDLRIFGFYAGLVFGSPHLNIDQCTCSFCHVGYGFDSQRLRTDSHATVGKYVSTGTNICHWGGWGPGTGLTGLPDARQRVWLSILCWDVEDGSIDTPSWDDTVFHLYDPSNAVHGIINYNRTLQGTGSMQGLTGGPGLILEGGANVTFRELRSGGVVTRDAVLNKATAATLSEFTPAVEFVELTGTGTITAFSPGIAIGELHTLKAGAQPISITNTAAGLMRLSGDWGGANSNFDTLTIRWDGNYWVEVARSVNVAGV